MKKLYFIILYTIIFLIIPFTISAIVISPPISGEESNIVEIVRNIFLFGLALVGITALAMVIYGGILYFLSAGNVVKASKGKEAIWNAIIGIIIVAGSYLVLYTINPDLVKLREPGISPLEGVPLPSLATSLYNAYACINPQTSKVEGCYATLEECRANCSIECSFQSYCQVGQTVVNACLPLTANFHEPTTIKQGEKASLVATFKPKGNNPENCTKAQATFTIRGQPCIKSGAYYDVQSCLFFNQNYKTINAQINCPNTSQCTASGEATIYDAGTYTASVVAKIGGQLSPAIETSNVLTVSGQEMYACRQPRTKKERDQGLVGKIVACYTDEKTCNEECHNVAKGAICEAKPTNYCAITDCEVKIVQLKNQDARCTLSSVIAEKHSVIVVVDTSNCYAVSVTGEGSWKATLQLIKGIVSVGQSGPEIKYENYGAPIEPTTPLSNNRVVFTLEPFKAADVGNQFYVQIRLSRKEGGEDKLYEIFDYYKEPIYVVKDHPCTGESSTATTTR